MTVLTNCPSWNPGVYQVKGTTWPMRTLLRAVTFLRRWLIKSGCSLSKALKNKSVKLQDYSSQVVMFIFVPVQRGNKSEGSSLIQHIVEPSSFDQVNQSWMLRTAFVELRDDRALLAINGRHDRWDGMNNSIVSFVVGALDRPAIGSNLQGKKIVISVTSCD